MYLPYFGTQKRPVADSSGVWIKEELFGDSFESISHLKWSDFEVFWLFFTCATLTVCVYPVEFLSRQTSISRWLILRGIFWKKQMHRSYLIFNQSEDHLIVIPLVDCDSPFGDHSIRKKYGLLPLWNLNIFFFHFVGRKIWSEQRINIRCFHKTIKTKRSNGKESISRCTTIEGLQRWCLSRSTIGRLWTGSLPTDCRPNLLTMLVFSGNIMSTI